MLGSLQPDVVLVQEAPRFPGSWLLNRRLARRAGLRVATGGAPAAGNLLLVSRRTAVVEAYPVKLPRRRGLHRRGAVLGVVAVEGRELRVLGTHLDLEPSARLASAQRLRTAVSPDVVAADVNDEPGSAAWQALSDGLVDVAAACGPTFPLRAPRRRIDGVFVAPALDVVWVDVPAVPPVTDHLPVVVDLAWPAG